MVKSFLGIDPGHDKEEIKSLPSYICMNIYEYFINVWVCVREREFESVRTCFCVFAYLYFTLL
jgi:hypothetical protein